MSPPFRLDRRRDRGLFAGSGHPLRSVAVSEDHYFTAQPASDKARREITVTLAGREVTVETAAGVFSAAHIDLGTTVLLREVPKPPPGPLLDLGCGWGPIALTAAMLEPTGHVTAIDTNERALDLLRRNATRLGASIPLAPIVAVTPDLVPAESTFDAVWSNPPIRVGKEALHALLALWLPRLNSGGEAWLVVQKNLGADSLAPWIADQGWGDVDRVATSKGFRVLRLVRR